MSYGSDSVEAFRAAASYVDCILRGATVSELPVQFPTKFEFVIIADEVME
jgi:putative ABC transport system substrate-binding protein